MTYIYNDEVSDIEDLMLEDAPDFDSEISGILGSFHTDSSYDVNYILTTLNYKDLKKLQVAASAFKFNQVNFDEMIQRDIDYTRVNDDIVRGYLEKGEDKALFFPPLIVSVVGFDDKKKPVRKYEETHEEIETNGRIKSFKKRWDKHFEIEVPTLKQGHDIYRSDKYGDINIYKNRTSLKYDSEIVKLVVIDGQHRYKAIEKFLERNPNEGEFLNVPVCVCFSPKAIENNGSEDILDTLRNMFVTINNKGKQVSGHYLDLLNDRSLASFTVRTLADDWKNSSDDVLRNMLHFIEWNQREDSKARRVNRPYSIATVSMLCETLRRSVFLNDKNYSYLYSILDLRSLKSDLEQAGDSIHNIYENDFTYVQQEILYKQIKDKLIEPIKVLLTEPSVFSRKIDSFYKAIDWLDKQNEVSDKEGVASFIKVLSDFRDVDRKIHQEETKLVSNQFNDKIQSNSHLDNYTRLVFNQAYFRLWSRLLDSSELFRDDILQFTKVYIQSLEKVAFSETSRLFSKDREFNQLTLYKSNKPNTTNLGKDCWLYLLTMSLMNRDSYSILKDYITSKENHDDALKKFNTIIKESKLDFLEKLEEEIVKDSLKNWRLKEYPLSFKNELEVLERSGSPEDRLEIQKLIKDKSKETYEYRLSILSNVIDVEVERILER
ncbi:hypothetical protein J7X13_003327 [Vibrio parahaemolyticus]|uniref:DNA sulfur modification protein DndB n=1 Tax=Vibrio parahaemolyticus TaxID=670 RepID=UPI00084AB989|nr:DNA sulfur modification protein DndB [Vibrio parahaemolyticus]EHH2502122.1 hypothetical protein [Vibrio parahaemolyticus]EKY4891879.1 hypothetical protein [Vibrio parahaemolyticus]ODZ18747.1 hypothetical protein BBM36_19460 [Vibrio parahaemolyticus]OEA54586.1 hypothetical protein BBM65_17615 [Vibrio parahaemolyticus]OEA63201.1 hypothetical protein BBM66_17515 [Vibrio parahaemolyticus]